MSGERSPEYRVARRALLDALEALGRQREAVVLVGAQAIYVHTGDAKLAVAEYTTDADVALDPSKLAHAPELAAAMRAAGFYQEQTKDGPLIGIWCSLREIAGVAAVLPRDLLARIAAGDKDLGGRTPDDYHLSGERLNEATNRARNRLQGAWSASVGLDKDASIASPAHTSCRRSGRKHSTRCPGRSQP